MTDCVSCCARRLRCFVCNPGRSLFAADSRMKLMEEKWKGFRLYLSLLEMWIQVCMPVFYTNILGRRRQYVSDHINGGTTRSLFSESVSFLPPLFRLSNCSHGRLYTKGTVWMCIMQNLMWIMWYVKHTRTHIAFFILFHFIIIVFFFWRRCLLTNIPSSCVIRLVSGVFHSFEVFDTYMNYTYIHTHI